MNSNHILLLAILLTSVVFISGCVSQGQSSESNGTSPIVTGKCTFNNKVGDYRIVGVQEGVPSYLASTVEPGTLVIQAAYDLTTKHDWSPDRQYEELRHTNIYLIKFDSEEKANSFYTTNYENYMQSYE